MSDPSYNDIIDPSGGRGRNIKVLITNQGILRIYYNDVSSNIYTAVVKRSNYKQIIYDSSNNRTEPMSDNSMNTAYYGGPYKIARLYGISGIELSDMQFNNLSINHDIYYDASGAIDNSYYNTEGINTANIPYKYWDTRSTGFTFDSSTNYLHFSSIETSLDVTPLLNPPQSLINTGYYVVDNSFSPMKKIYGSGSASTIVASTNSYYNSSVAPTTIMQMVDGSNNEPKGFVIYATGGNIASANAINVGRIWDYSMTSLEVESGANFDNTKMYCDIDMDISWNATDDASLNGIRGRPFFIYNKNTGADENARLGTLPYNFGVGGRDSGGTTSANIINALTGTTPLPAQFCKIKCRKQDPSGSPSWADSKLHVVMFDPRTGLEGGGQLVYVRYDANNLTEGGESGARVIDGSAGTVNEGAGLFCSLDLSGNNPHVAYYDCENQSIKYAWSNDGGDNWEPYTTLTPGISGEIIDTNVGNYLDLTNNSNIGQLISIACSPIDGSTHIAYYDNSSVKYWTNSTNTPKPITNAIPTQLSTIAYSKKIENFGNDISSNIPHIDLSWNFPASDNSNNPVYSSESFIITPLTKINNAIYDATWYDIVYVATKVRTPSVFGAVDTSFNNLFCLGGSTGSDGAYYAGLYNGSPFFGVPNNFNSANRLTANVFLKPLTNYNLEFYYNKNDKYAFITVNTVGEVERNFEWEDISSNGGFNMNDGYLSIGCAPHDTTNSWRGANNDGIIKNFMLWNTDISNVPTFDICRNGVIIATDIRRSYITDASGTAGLIKDVSYNYKVRSTGNSINVSQDISAGNTYTKNSYKYIEDLWYYGKIMWTGQTDISSAKIWSFDGSGDEIWAGGEYNSDRRGLLMSSLDGGQSWTQNTIHPTHDISYAPIFSVKQFTDLSGIKWVWYGGGNYALCYSNDLSNSPVGTAWKIIGDSSGVNLNGTSSTDVTFDKTKRSIRAVYPVNFSSYASSNAIFGSDPSYNGFHLWVGTGPTSSYAVDPSGYTVDPSGSFDMVIRGDVHSFDPANAPTPDFSNNIIWREISNNPVYDISNERINAIDFGNPEVNRGIIGMKSYIFVTDDDGLTWNQRMRVGNQIDLSGGANVRGVYVEKNPTYPDVYDPSFSVQMNAMPYDEKSGNGLVISKSRSFDNSFNPLAGTGIPTETWDPSLNTNKFWDPNAPPFELSKYDGDYSNGGNRYIVDICKNITSNTNRKYYDNHWSFGNRITTTDFSDNFIFHKNNVTDSWSRIESYNLNKNPYAIGILDNSGIVVSQDNELYKLSQTPIPPDISAIYPYQSNNYKARINLSGLIVDIQMADPNPLQENVNFKIWQKINTEEWSELTAGFEATIQADVDLEPQKTYFYKAQASNNYGESWYSPDISFSTPVAIPEITGLASEGSLLYSRVYWESATDTQVYNIELDYFVSNDYSGSRILYSGISAEILDLSFTNFQDLSLNGMHTFKITPRGYDQSGSTYQTTVDLVDGVPFNTGLTYDYYTNKATLSWKNNDLYVDPNDMSGTWIGWDISMQQMDSSGEIIGQKSFAIAQEKGNVVNIKSYDISGTDIEPDSSYNFYIRADYSNNKISENSKYSYPLFQRIIAEVPSNFNASYNTGTDDITYTWDANTNTPAYYLLYQVNSRGVALPGLPPNAYEYYFDISSSETTKIVKGRDYPPSGLDGDISGGAWYTRIKSIWTQDMSSAFAPVPPLFYTPFYIPNNFKTEPQKQDGSLSTNLEDVYQIKLSWEDVCGNNGYDISRVEIDSSGATYDLSTNVALNVNYIIDQDSPLGSITPFEPRVYKYSIRTKFP